MERSSDRKDKRRGFQPEKRRRGNGAMTKVHAMFGKVAGVFMLRIAAALYGPANAADTTARTLNVVVLHSGSFFLPASYDLDQGLREAMGALTPRHIEFYLEALETYRLREFGEDELGAHLRKKYQDFRGDLIVAIGSTALLFAERARSEIWPGVPIVFLGVVSQTVRDRRLGPGITGQLIRYDIGGTIDLAARLHPAASRMAVIAGTAPLDRGWIPQVNAELGRYVGRVSPIYLTNQTLPELVGEVRQLPPDTFALYTNQRGALSRGGREPDRHGLPLFARHDADICQRGVLPAL